MKKPEVCLGVKCMQRGCKNESSHKVGEHNIWDRETESEEHTQFTKIHELTTYLCNEHFTKLMEREEFYGDVSKYKRD